MKSCGTCKWWDVENSYKPLGVDRYIRADCLFKMMKVPDSVSCVKSFRFESEGQSCPCYEKRD